MDAESLVNAISNDRRDWEEAIVAIKMLNRVMNRAANRLAKENAAWHDDPQSLDHAASHAPAEQQFPTEIRKEAILEIVKDQLDELALQETVKGTVRYYTEQQMLDLLAKWERSSVTLPPKEEELTLFFPGQPLNFCSITLHERKSSGNKTLYRVAFKRKNLA